MTMSIRQHARGGKAEFIPREVTREPGGLIVSCARITKKGDCGRCIFGRCCQRQLGIADAEMEALRATFKLFKKMKELMERRLAWKKN